MSKNQGTGQIWNNREGVRPVWSGKVASARNQLVMWSSILSTLPWWVALLPHSQYHATLSIPTTTTATPTPTPTPTKSSTTENREGRRHPKKPKLLGFLLILRFAPIFFRRKRTKKKKKAFFSNKIFDCSSLLRFLFVLDLYFQCYRAFLWSVLWFLGAHY